MSDQLAAHSETITPERIDEVDISSEMETSFLEYAYSVIYSRALPDARDGLKPVQRRILYMMTDMGLRPEKGHVKSARVVGEVMGKLHPHGDSPIYDALVRLAQPFALRIPLIDGHGNFGSLDDGPAASRYTEARLAAAALSMTQHLDEDVVDFVPNYDNQFMQPAVLPAAIPNLLVNGASGIAVGMATNLAPHNLVEVIEGAKHLLAHPEATSDDLMRFIPAPDLPGGGIIVGLDGVKDAYRTGRGAFRTRAKVRIEQITARRTGLVITELPYLIGPERVIDRIKQGVEAKKLEGIADVADLTDRKNGLKLVITLKTGFSPEAVLEQLYRVTPLEDSFSINSVALVDGQPRTLSLRDMLRVFLDHRLDVVTRRSRFRLQQRTDRLHLVEGLLIAIVDIDEVIQLIRSSDDADQARERLRQVFDLSAPQAEYILELRLRRLTKFSRLELEAERERLEAEIAELRRILEDDVRLREVVAEELEEVAQNHGTPRRTVLTEAADAPARTRGGAEPLEIADVPCRVLVSTTGRALRIERDPDAAPAEPSAPRPTQHGALLASVDTTTRTEIGAVLSDGTLLRFTAVDLPRVPGASVSFAAGVPVAHYLGLPESSPTVIGIVPLEDATPIGLVTAQGVVKRVLLQDLPAKPSFEIITLKPGDTLVAACPAPDAAEFAVVADDAQLLRFPCASVRPQGRAAGGMAGMALKDGARTVFGTAIPAEVEPLVVTVAAQSDALFGIAPASGKISRWSEFPPKGRGTGGVRAQRFLKGEFRLTCAWVGTGTPRALTAEGLPVDLPTQEAKRDASGSPLTDAVTSIGAAV